MRQYDDLRDLVTIESVGTDHGTRNIDHFQIPTQWINWMIFLMIQQ